MEDSGVITLVAIIAFVVIVFVVYAIKEQGLADPSNSRMIYTTQMAENMVLPNQAVSAFLVRQSGNLYRDLGVFPSPQSALSEIEKAFRRAKIDSVAVLKNTDKEFRVLRLHHSHGGKAEGKKLGGACIRIV